MSAAPLGPVSDAAVTEISTLVRQRGPVIWLDRYGHYTALVDGLIARHAAGDLSFPVLGYRGSFLELMLGLERHGNGLDPEPLLIHLPGYDAVNSARRRSSKRTSSRPIGIERRSTRSSPGRRRGAWGPTRFSGSSRRRG